MPHHLRRNLLRFGCALSLLGGSPVWSMTLVTEEDPPYSFTRDKHPDGFAVEVVNEIKRRLHITDRIQIEPWTRVYDSALHKANVAAFSMSRTQEREALFYWIGPIVENDWVLVTKRSSGIHLASLDDAKKLRAIGAVRGYAWTRYLDARGFKNLDRVWERKLNSLKLQAGRLDAFVSADLSYVSEIQDNGLNPADFEVTLRFNSVQMYIALSKQTDQQTVNRWAQAFESMKEDGTFEKIHAKWLPNHRLPGEARPADF